MKLIRKHQKTYALHRISLAIDRLIAANSSETKEKAAKWAAAWNKVLDMKPLSD